MLQDVSLRSIQNKLVGRERIEQICAIWGLTEEIKGSDLLQMAQLHITARMKNRVAARFIWQQLSSAEQRCLYEVLCAKDQGKGVPFERVRKKVKLAPDELDTVVCQLKDCWLLVEEDEILIKPSARTSEHLQIASPVPARALFPYRECSESLWRTGRELFLSYENRSMQSHLHLLSLMRWEKLEHLAHVCHVAVRSGLPMYAYGATHPSEVQTRVAEALQQAHILFELLHSLDPMVQDFFLWLCTHEGNVTMEEAQAYLTAQRCTGEGFYSLFESLEAHALAFDTLLPGGQRTVFIPQELLAAVRDDVRQYTSDEQRSALIPMDLDPVVSQEGLPLVLYDLATVIGWTYQQTIERTKDGNIPKRWVAKIRPMLHGRPRIRETEDGYVDQLFSTAKELELLSCVLSQEEEKPRYRPTPILSHFQQLTVVEQMRRFLHWWCTSSTWCDLRPNGRVISASITNAGAARKALLAELKKCVPGKWYLVDALLFAIWTHTPLSLYDPFQRQVERLSLRERRDQWMKQGDGLLYTALLFSTLHESGVVSLGYHHAEPGTNPPDLFQITPLGAAALRETEVGFEPDSASLLMTAKKKLIIQPSFEVLLFQFDGDIHRLIQFAQIKRIGSVSSFVLTQAALLRGLEAGNHLEDIFAFLTAGSQRDLPQNVDYTLRDWARGYKEARVSPVLLIELVPPSQSEADLYRALADLEVEARKLAPGMFAIAAETIPFSMLRRRLEKEGLVVRGTPAARPRWR